MTDLALQDYQNHTPVPGSEDLFSLLQGADQEDAEPVRAAKKVKKVTALEARSVHSVPEWDNQRSLVFQVK